MLKHALLVKGKQKKEKQEEEDKLINEAREKDDKVLHDLITDAQFLTAYDESFAAGTAEGDEYLP